MKTGTRTPLPDFKRKTKGFWKTGELLECTNITAENTNVNSYSFKDPGGKGFQFKPGQHISIIFRLSVEMSTVHLQYAQHRRAAMKLQLL